MCLLPNKVRVLHLYTPCTHSSLAGKPRKMNSIIVWKFLQKEYDHLLTSIIMDLL